MSLYTLGDIHGDLEIKALFDINFPAGKSLTKDDYVLICGDFGLIFDHTSSGKTEQKWIDWLTHRPWTTLFIDGNHECHPRLLALPTKEMFGSEVGIVSDSIFHLKRGNIYNIDSNKCFCFGGADSIDKDYRIQGISWWPEEIPNRKEFNLGLKNLIMSKWEVDYVFTHTAPHSVLPEFYKSYKPNDPTQKMLDEYYEKLKFKHWYCGHFHVNKDFADNVSCLYHKIVKVF